MVSEDSIFLFRYQLFFATTVGRCLFQFTAAPTMPIFTNSQVMFSGSRIWKAKKGGMTLVLQLWHITASPSSSPAKDTIKSGCLQNVVCLFFCFFFPYFFFGKEENMFRL